MKLVETLRSKQGRTIKQVFLSQDDVLEFSYINKGDGKDIVVVPSQTACPTCNRNPRGPSCPIKCDDY